MFEGETEKDKVKSGQSQLKVALNSLKSIITVIYITATYKKKPVMEVRCQLDKITYSNQERCRYTVTHIRAQAMTFSSGQILIVQIA